MPHEFTLDSLAATNLLGDIASNYLGRVLGYPQAGKVLGKMLQQSESDTYQFPKKVYKAKTSSKRRKSTKRSSVGEKKTKKQASNSAKKGKKCVVKNVCKELQTLKKSVATLKKEQEAETGLQDFREGHSLDVTCAVGNTTVTSVSIFGVSDLQACITSLKYFDPSTPGTLITVNGNTPTFQNEFYFKSVNCYVEATNNYQVPCYIDLYLMQPKSDTSVLPHTAYTNGLTDVGGPSSTSPMVRLYDSPQLRDLWMSKVRKENVLLLPGQSLKLTYKCGDFFYDNSLEDSHALEYQKRWEAVTFCVRIRGQMGHDTVLDQQGFLQAGVDIDYGFNAKITYPAGADIVNISLNEQRDTAFTNGGVCSVAPISDNVGYSLS